MCRELDRRDFLAWSTATAAAATMLSLGSQVAAADSEKPVFEISLAEWSLHKALFGEQDEQSRLPAAAKRDYGIEAVEYVNQFFKDKAKDTAYLADLKQRGRRRWGQERTDHDRRRRPTGRSRRGEAEKGGREPLPVGRGGEVSRLPRHPRQCGQQR